MSEAARAALINIGTNRQGATPPPMTPADVLRELQEMGLLGKEWGLTRRGTIKRQLLVEDQLNELFG